MGSMVGPGPVMQHRYASASAPGGSDRRPEVRRLCCRALSVAASQITWQVLEREAGANGDCESENDRQEHLLVPFEVGTVAGQS